MRNLSRAMSLVAVPIFIWPAFADAGQRTVTARVPPSRYVTSDNPACGVQGPLTKLSDPAIVAVTGRVNAYAGAAVLVIGEGTKIAEHSGGAFAGLIRSMNGPDWSSCADMCVATDEGADLKQVDWSDRDGGYGGVSLSKATAGIENYSTKDFSGWRNFIAFQAEGKWIVCGTGTNWSGDKPAIKRIRVTW